MFLIARGSTLMIVILENGKGKSYKGKIFSTQKDNMELAVANHT